MWGNHTDFCGLIGYTTFSYFFYHFSDLIFKAASVQFNFYVFTCYSPKDIGISLWEWIPAASNTMPRI